jgi:hypothetical protein
MKKLAIALILVCTPALAGSSKKALRTDYDNVCNALERSGAAHKPRSEKPQAIAAWLHKTLKTPEVKKLLGELPTLPPEQQGPALKKAAAEAGYTGACPIVDAKN